MMKAIIHIFFQISIEWNCANLFMVQKSDMGCCCNLSPTSHLNANALSQRLNYANPDYLVSLLCVLALNCSILLMGSHFVVLLICGKGTFRGQLSCKLHSSYFSERLRGTLIVAILCSKWTSFFKTTEIHLQSNS